MKILMIGDRCIGKTKILVRKQLETYSGEYSPTENYNWFKINYKNKDVGIIMDVCDTGLNFDYNSEQINPDAIVICFNLQLPSSMLSSRDLFQWKLQKYPNIPTILCGCCADLDEHCLIEAQVNQFKYDFGINIPYIKVSSKDNINIDQLFDVLANFHKIK
jgi:GTPase SAR1 family protein